tara:strand:+ start:88 stop:471 length:384 start_codon:yes stop_codon:yes gene_type:complete
MCTAQRMYIGDPDSGKMTVTGGQPGYASTVEKKDGEWMDVKSLEYEQWGDKQKVQTGNAPPPDKVNNQVIDNQSARAQVLGPAKETVSSPPKKKEDLKVRLKGRSSQKDMTGNITKDADLREGGINI